MGQRGPKPTAAATLKARGTFRADRHRDSAKPTGTPKCPSWVTDKDAKGEFRRLVKLLGGMGLIGAADTNVLIRYSICFVRWKRIAQALAANPSAEFATYRDTDGKVKAVQVSALHTSARSLSDELTRAEAVLGMTPSSRSRIEVSMTPPAPTTPDSKSRFFFGEN